MTRKPYRSAIFMSRDSQTWEFKRALLQNEEPCWAYTLQTVKLLESTDETKTTEG